MGLREEACANMAGGPCEDLCLCPGTLVEGDGAWETKRLTDRKEVCAPHWPPTARSPLRFWDRAFLGVGLSFKSNILLSVLFNKTIVDKAVLCLQNGCVIKVKIHVCTHVVDAALLGMWKLKVTLWESALSFHHVGPRDQTQQVPLDDKCHYLPSHLSSPRFRLLVRYIAS